MKNRQKRDPEQRAIVLKVEQLTGYSVRHIDRVISGEIHNNEILSTYMFLKEGENLLLAAAKELVPFN